LCVSLVMNLIPGGNCYEYVEQNFPLPFADIRKIFTGIVAGVNAMHQVYLFHVYP
jgi:serine/threonine protein kinase